MLITQYDCIEFVKVDKASTTGRNPFSATMPIRKPARSSDSQAPPPPDTSFTTSGIQKHQDDVVIA